MSDESNRFDADLETRREAARMQGFELEEGKPPTFEQMGPMGSTVRHAPAAEGFSRMHVVGPMMGAHVTTDVKWATCRACRKSYAEKVRVFHTEGGAVDLSTTAFALTILAELTPGHRCPV